jgi:hypothetical protein
MKTETVTAEVVVSKADVSASHSKRPSQASLSKSPWVWLGVPVILLAGYSWGLSDRPSGPHPNESPVNGFFDFLEMVVIRSALLGFTAAGALALLERHLKGHGAPAATEAELVRAVLQQTAQIAELTQVVTQLAQASLVATRSSERTALPPVSLTTPQSPSEPVTILTTVRAVHIPDLPSPSRLAPAKAAVPDAPKTVYSPPSKKAVAPSRPVASTANTPVPRPVARRASHQEIEKRAYANWVAGGRKPGTANADWIRAEQELLAEIR